MRRIVHLSRDSGGVWLSGVIVVIISSRFSLILLGRSRVEAQLPFGRQQRGTKNSTEKQNRVNRVRGDKKRKGGQAKLGKGVNSCS